MALPLNNSLALLDNDNDEEDYLFDDDEEEYMQLLHETNASAALYILKKRKRHGGSRPGRLPNIDRDHMHLGCASHKRAADVLCTVHEFFSNKLRNAGHFHLWGPVLSPSMI